MRLSADKSWREPSLIPRGGPAIQIDSWANRPAVAGMPNGRLLLYRPTGVYYLANQAFGDWLRAEHVWRRAVTKNADLDGATVPGSESPAWAETKTGAGAMTTGGGPARVTFSALVGADYAYATVTHAGPAGTDAWFSGNLRTASVGGSDPSSLCFLLSDGTVSICLSLANGAASRLVRFCAGFNGAAVGTMAQGVNLDVESWVEMYVVGQSAYAYVNQSHDPVAFAARPLFGALSNKVGYLGKANNVGTGQVIARNLGWGLLT